MACSTANLDYSSLPPTQEVIADSQWVRYPCLTSIDNNSQNPLEFRLDRTNTFTDLQQLYLHVKFKVVKADGSDLTDKDAVSTVNNFAYSMFSSVEMFI